jgi:hypothetical protein
MIKCWRNFYLWKVVNPKIRKIERLSDLEDEIINKIELVSCRSSLLWINGKLLVRISFGVFMESFL